MWGFDLVGFIGFLKQGGLAVAGAAALWGFIFAIYAHKKKHTTDWITFHHIAHRLFWLVILGTVVSSFAWIVSVTHLYAHEGIIIIPTDEEIIRAFALMEPLYILWTVLAGLGFVVWIASKHLFHKILPLFFILQFILAFILTSFPAFTGTLDRVQLFFMGHGFHSIFTLGTVIVLDYLFLTSKSSLHLRQNIFPLFPTISKVIWVGLAIDFLSVWLVFAEAIQLTPRFFFMQTVVGILIINGILLSGPITRMMLKTVSKEKKELSRKEELAADIAGTISITSWTSITFIDYFHDLTLNYFQLFAGYIVVLLILYAGHRFWLYIDSEDPFSKALREKRIG